MMRLSDIKLNEDNPRYIKDAQFEKLVKSIRDFPRMLELRPIVIDGDGVIVGGNMRYRALLEIGYGEVDDSWIKQASDFTLEELREFVIKDNLPFGDWDWEELANNWDEEDLEGWGLEIPGFENEAGGEVNGNEKEKKDASDSIQGRFAIEVTCSSEEENEALFTKLTEEGYLCRILIF